MSRPHDPFFDGDQRARRPGLRLAAEDGQRAPGMPEEPQDPLAGLADQPAIDPLLHCLAWLTQHHGRARSPESLRAGAPIDGQLSPDQAIRLMREAGYNAGLLRKGIDEINALLLPAVLLLNGGDACVLVRRLDDGQDGSGARYEVVFPGPEAASCVAPASELDQEYSGFILAVTPQEQSQAKPLAGEPPLLQPEKHWLWGTLRRFVPYYRSAMLAALLSNVLMLVSGLVTSVIYDKVIPHQAYVTLWTLAVGAGLALLFDMFSRQLRSHLIDLAGRKTDLIIGAKLFRQTLGVRMEHKPASAGSYAHYLAQVEVVRDFFTSATMSALTDLPFIILFVAMTFIVGGPLGWVLMAAIPLMLGMSLAIQGYLRRAMRTNMTEAADLHGTLVEALEGLEDLKTSGAEGRFLRRYEQSTAIVAESALRARTMSSWSMNISMTMQQLINLVMLVWGVYLIGDGVISPGALIGAVMFAGRATMPLNSLVSLATRYQGARAAMLSLNSVMSAPTERDSQRNYVPLTQVSGRMGLTDVGFSYPAQGDAQSPKVLRNVTLRIQPGERIAILGRIGSGKSTVLRMLAGLYQPTEGMVEVDGIDLRQVDPAEFRSKVGFCVAGAAPLPRHPARQRADGPPRGCPASGGGCQAHRAGPGGGQPSDGLGSAGRRDGHAAVRRSAAVGGTGPQPGHPPADSADGRTHQLDGCAVRDCLPASAAGCRGRLHAGDGHPPAGGAGTGVTHPGGGRRQARHGRPARPGAGGLVGRAAGRCAGSGARAGGTCRAGRPGRSDGTDGPGPGPGACGPGRSGGQRHRAHASRRAAGQP